MWLGGVRRPVFVPLMSVIMGFAFAFIFLNLIYVALPLGQGPFTQVSLVVMKLVGVN
jgi:putative tricarboxylic transport membrane protein